MKVSELIERLEQLLEDHGDMEAWVDTRFCSYRAGPVTTADFDSIGNEEDSGGPCIAIISD